MFMNFRYRFYQRNVLNEKRLWTIYYDARSTGIMPFLFSPEPEPEMLALFQHHLSTRMVNVVICKLVNTKLVNRKEMRIGERGGKNCILGERGDRGGKEKEA